MAKTQTLGFKQGDDFKLDFTLTDTNHTGAIAAKAALDQGILDLAALEAAVPQDPVAIAAAESDIVTLDAAYQAAIILDITAWGIDSQLRWCGKLIDTFVIDRTDVLIGKFVLTRDAAATALWTPRKYEMDIQFTPPTGKISSETFILDVEKDVTNV